MPRVSQAEAKLTRQRIINASLKIVVEDGVAELSFANIAKKAKISRSGINAHFKRKENLFEELRPLLKEMVMAPLDFSSPDMFLKSWIKVLDENPAYRVMLTNSDQVMGGERAAANLLTMIEGNRAEVRDAVYYALGYALVNYPSN
ncbi:TetR family transcriptional regulator [Vibrio cortegadensis]|uniref:TetR family transcriptional regulator n=1 Tax=Vibrio cortegadensis TaxID=1328770 RepID=UPI0021C4C30F|nr:TetR family transcriptional regulator [Vibrio cortegadensis]MDN3697313.1 TetR family transcriptional regulator [Vibrio cortegadensis]